MNDWENVQEKATGSLEAGAEKDGKWELECVIISKMHKKYVLEGR